MIRKPFEVEEYNQNHQVGRGAIRAYLDRVGHFTLQPEDKYGSDLVSYRKVRHEVEIKRVWTGDWPSRWDTIQVPERKSHLSKSKVPVVIWVLRSDLTQAWVIRGDQLKTEYLEEVPNTKVAAGEYFYRIPVDDCRLVDLVK